jgi:N-acetylglucosamine kinase-like BadF-type ATPase
MLLSATRSKDVNTLLHRFYTDEFSRAQIAGYSKLVTEAAQSGDRVALEILEEAARELARYVEGVYSTLFANGDSAPVAYIGGVFQSGYLLKIFSNLIEKKLGIKPQPPLFAFRSAGLSVSLSGLPHSEK